MLTLKKALSKLESGDWCALRFMTAHVKKGTGGKVLEFAKCRIARMRTTTTASPAARMQQGAGEKKRDAHHNENFTRNKELEN